MSRVALRILTTLSVAAIAFWAGVWVDAARTTEIEIPSSLPPITTTAGSGSVQTTWMTATSVERQPDRVATAATIAALVAAAFLLARLAIAVVRRRRARAA